MRHDNLLFQQIIILFFNFFAEPDIWLVAESLYPSQSTRYSIELSVIRIFLATEYMRYIFILHHIKLIYCFQEMFTSQLSLDCYKGELLNLIRCQKYETSLYVYVRLTIRIIRINKGFKFYGYMEG
jgi:hypothetical protein